MPSTAPLQPRDFLILLALADRDRHGYGLVKEIDSLSDGQVRMDPANLYRALRRLVRDGWVEDLGLRAGESAPRRRYYALSAEGRRLAATEARRLERLTAVARSRLLPADVEALG